MKMQSTTGGQHGFATVPKAEIQRSSFNRSSGHKTTFAAGFLVPIFCDEALPGDTFNLRMHTFGRMATLLFPLMDNVYLDSHFFAVPIRLIWDNWQKFNGEQTDPGDSTDFLIPQITSLGGTPGSRTLSDHMGIPTSGGDITHSSLWHRAYNLIYNEWFRDENLVDSVVVDRDDGPDTLADYVLLRRGKRHDYFTSCLPFAQKGDPVELPLGTSAPVTVTNTITGDGVASFIPPGSISRDLTYTASTGNVAMSGTGGSDGALPWDDPNLASTGTGTADLSAATAATINQIREAFQIQRLFERDARGGSRYTEIVRAHFGVVSPDQRLQRPEYLGGGSQPITINQVESNSAAASGTVGTLTAYATTQGSSHSFVKSFTEHCVIIGLVSVRADLNYQQGLNRMFSRRTRFDFYWPALSHIGEQAVLNKEIFAQGDTDPTTDELVFGYQERYAEYRYKPSVTSGEFRSDYVTPLDSWHLAQDFSVLPTLGETFIEENPPITRVIAAPADAQFLLDAYFDLKCARPMPTYGVPGLIDHF